MNSLSPIRVPARVRSTLAVGLWFALAAGVAAGCGSSSSDKGCVPGQSIACAGTGACQGNQICKSDGSGYGECLCGGSSADSGSHPFAHVGPYSGLLGAACTTATECRQGLECVTGDSKLVGGEGPSGGLCLTQCLVAHDFCAAVDATAQCVVLDDRGTPTPTDDLAYCLPGCKLGTQPGSADKCRGRLDLVCTESPAGTGAGYCKPACRSDVDCAPRVCDLATGLCADSAPPGEAIGAACGATTQCVGGCFAPTPSYSACSGICSYGTEGCGQHNDPPLDYFCAVGASTGAGDGDLGYCAKLCDCDNDCAASSGVCEPRADLMSKAGHHGFCTSPLGPTGKPTSHVPCAP